MTAICAHHGPYATPPSADCPRCPSPEPPPERHAFVPCYGCGAQVVGCHHHLGNILCGKPESDPCHKEKSMNGCGCVYESSDVDDPGRLLSRCSRHTKPVPQEPRRCMPGDCICSEPVHVPAPPPEPESEKCQSCGRRYPEVWWAAHDLFAKVTGRTDGGGLRCISCFDAEARKRGIYLRWAAENLTEPVEGPGGQEECIPCRKGEPHFPGVAYPGLPLPHRAEGQAAEPDARGYEIIEPEKCHRCKAPLIDGETSTMTLCGMCTAWPARLAAQDKLLDACARMLGFASLYMPDEALEGWRRRSASVFAALASRRRTW